MHMIIKYSKQAEKFLKQQPQNISKRIREAINDLPMGDVKKLRGMKGYRLRVGSYRVIFDRDGNVLYISKIDSRGQVYR